jgi:hypothetical protein
VLKISLEVALTVFDAVLEMEASVLPELLPVVAFLNSQP